MRVGGARFLDACTNYEVTHYRRHRQRVKGLFTVLCRCNVFAVEVITDEQLRKKGRWYKLELDWVPIGPLTHRSYRSDLDDEVVVDRGHCKRVPRGKKYMASCSRRLQRSQVSHLRVISAMLRKFHARH